MAPMSRPTGLSVLSVSSSLACVAAPLVIVRSMEGLQYGQSDKTHYQIVGNVFTLFSETVAAKNTPDVRHRFHRDTIRRYGILHSE